MAVAALYPAINVQAELAICTTPQRPQCPAALPWPAKSEFTFSRLIFSDNQRAIDDLGDRIGYPHWQADCSESEPHFIAAMKRLTRVDTNADSQSISLLDERVFDYPFLYIVEAGFAAFNGKYSLGVNVFAMGEQDIIETADAAKAFVVDRLVAGVEMLRALWWTAWLESGEPREERG